MKHTTTTTLLFTAGNRTLGLPVEHIVEVVPVYEMLPAPGARSAVAGMISYRGNVLPVIDCRYCLERIETELQPQQKFIIAAGQQKTVALIIDEIGELVTLEGDGTGMRDTAGSSPDGIFRIAMHNGDIVMLIDIDACLNGHSDEQRLPHDVGVAAHRGELQLEQ